MSNTDNAVYLASYRGEAVEVLGRQDIQGFSFVKYVGTPDLELTSESIDRFLKKLGQPTGIKIESRAWNLQLTLDYDIRELMSDQVAIE